jgi:UDP-2,3-diacylglucosamine pyrophosphatase LpxH
MLVRDERIDKALSAAYADAQEIAPFEVDRGRIVILSDQHRGARNGADDFVPAETAYNAALDHYYAQGYLLTVLGDAEELWEERPEVVLKAHEKSLRNEVRFHQDGRYLRVHGNHDDAWLSERVTQKHLVPLFGSLPRMATGYRMKVVDRGKPLGEFFLTHGHQGTGDSDRFAGLSKLIVRYLWRPLQRLTRYSFNTPSTDFSLREHHDQTMYSWAAGRHNTVLIVGHTHRPVFKSQKHSVQLKRAIAQLETQLKERGDDSELLHQLNDLRLRLEHVLKQDGQSADQEDADMSKPCYFNTGCCCFPDGDITGIELIGSEIRLVRWSNTPDKQQKILARTSLRDVFEALA